MNKITALIAALSIIALVAAGTLIYISNGKKEVASEKAASEQTEGYKSFDGTVLSTSPDTLSVVVEETSSSSPAATKTLKIDSATRIEKVVVQNKQDGTLEKKLIDELNISDLKKGDVVTVVYTGSLNNTVTGVQSVQLTLEANVDAYIESKRKDTSNPLVYVRSKVAAVDKSGGSISFYTYAFDTVSTTTQSIALSKNLHIYQVSEEALVPIIHAREPGSLINLKPGDDFFIEVKKDGFDGTISNPLGVIIVKK